VLALVVLVGAGAVRVGRRPTAVAAARDDGGPPRRPSLVEWLRARRDVFEPKWGWLAERREFGELVAEGRALERKRVARGKRFVEASIAALGARDRAARAQLARGDVAGFVAAEWRREAAARAAVGDAAAATGDFVEAEVERLEDALSFVETFDPAAALADFVDDEWAREEAARAEARAFVADEFGRLGEMDAALDARIRGAPELTVCVADVNCGACDGARVHARLERLADAEAAAGRPRPLVRATAKCGSHCRANKVAVEVVGDAGSAVAFCEPLADCEDALGYCDPEATDRAVDATVDAQLASILARARTRGRARPFS